MPKQTILNPARELRFRHAPLSPEAPTEVWMPVYRGRQSEHDFLGYYQARLTLEEARQAAGGDHSTGHIVVGYARVAVEALELIAVAPSAGAGELPEAPEEEADVDF